MKKSHEIFIEGEVIDIRKDMLGWHVIHPIRKNGIINWKNLIAGGSWLKLVLIIIFVILCIGAMFEVREAVEIANECLKSEETFGEKNWGLPENLFINNTNNSVP